MYSRSDCSCCFISPAARSQLEARPCPPPGIPAVPLETAQGGQPRLFWIVTNDIPRAPEERLPPGGSLELESSRLGLVFAAIQGHWPDDGAPTRDPQRRPGNIR